MPLRGEQVAVERVGGDEWSVKFLVFAIRDRTWEFEACKAGELSRGPNLFWSEKYRDFVNGRADVPDAVLGRVADWLTAIRVLPA